MKDLPYFRWWVARADTDENYSSMTDQELGFYHRCLNKSWVNAGLPTDLDKLARLMKVTREYLDSVWGEVGRCWFQDGDRLFNRTQEEERTWATGKSVKASSSVRTRYERSNERSTNDSLRASDSDSASVSVRNIPIVAATLDFSLAGAVIFPKSWDQDEPFARFAADYIATGGSFIGEDFAEAWQFCWRTLDFEQKLARVAALNQHSAEYHSNPRFVPHPRKFLEREWKRPPKPEVAPRPNGAPTASQISQQLIRERKSKQHGK